jgi:hypothetical protein
MCVKAIIFKLIGHPLLNIQALLYTATHFILPYKFWLLQSSTQIFHLEGKHIVKQLVHKLTQNWSAFVTCSVVGDVSQPMHQLNII